MKTAEAMVIVLVVILLNLVQIDVIALVNAHTIYQANYKLF